MNMNISVVNPCFCLLRRYILNVDPKLEARSLLELELLLLVLPDAEQ